MISFRPEPGEVGQRIDVVVARRGKVTRSLAQKAIREGLITVDGVRARAAHRLEEGELVEGTIPAPGLPAPLAEDIPISIRYQDDRVLVVSKPSGMVTHPARGHEKGTLVNALLALGVPLAGAGSGRPGIVHRLDKDTSGLLLVAKDDDSNASLLAAMKRREIERRYVGLVQGAPSAPTGTIEAPVGRHPVRRQRMAVTAGGRPSVTHFQELGSNEDLTLLELKLETGRTHQIRVHLAHVNLPIVGDRTYGGSVEVARGLGLHRFFLHAWKLAFPHPTDGRRISVDDPLPADLLGALDAVGISYPQS